MCAEESRRDVVMYISDIVFKHRYSDDFCLLGISSRELEKPCVRGKRVP